MDATYHWALVACSLLIAIVASYTALDLAGRARATVGRSRLLWLGSAAAAMGGGIWAMHFVAMLALRMPGMAVSYDLRLTALSLVMAIAATGAGFALVARPQSGPLRLVGAGALMGLGVCTMHYLGMAAMRMTATIRYDSIWVGISVLVAVGAAIAALWLTGRSGGRQPTRVRLAASIAMGVAISGMHYAGMRAATFSTPQAGAPVAGGSMLDHTAVAVAVSCAAFTILFLAMIAAMFDRRMALLAAREAEALRHSEERFRSLYKGTPLPLHSLDREGRIEHVSHTWLELMGYAREEVVGRPLVNFLTEASARSLLQADWPQLLEQGFLSPREYKVVTRSGAFRDVVSSARVARDADGRFLRVLGGLTDVTERKQTEEALRQAQKIEAIGQLTGGIAHDFNNLLAVVIGNLDILRRRLGDDQRALRLIENAMKGADRGAALTQRLLTFARRQDLKLEPVDVRSLVHGMSDMLQRSLGPMVRVETRFPLDLPLAVADAHQLELAVLNLGVNARDAMPGGGSLVIAADQALVAAGNPEGLYPGTYLRLILTDNGSGMDADVLAHAVDPFYTTKEKGQGTGLGLSMVQGLAAQSGGRLLLQSEPGRGTTVEIWLPAAREAAASAPATEPMDRDRVALPVQPRRILVVDDDALVLANTAAMLEDLGHTVRAVHGGQEALDVLGRDGGFDLVVSDQLMPEMTGTQLRERMHAIAPGVPMLLVSGFADLAGAPGADVPLLRKPFTRDALDEAVAALPHLGATVVPLRAARR